MDNEPQLCVWTFTGLYNVDMGGRDEIDLGAGFFLSKSTPSLLSVRSRQDLSGRQFDEMQRLHSFLVHRESVPALRGPERGKKIDYFQDGLVALQVLKPLRTFGVIFQGSETGTDHLNLETVCDRPPMDPWGWAAMRSFDEEFFAEAPDTIKRVIKVKNATAAEPKNALSLLQLGLEHFHPLVAGLFCVMGLEAALGVNGRHQFRERLSACLGESTRVFPDWNSPAYPGPDLTVGQIAIDLYMLRNMIVHGLDLRKATHDKTTPVDLLKKVQVANDLHERANCVLLSEAALYLLCAVIRKKVLA
jgi:hypothetical protein